ncbi:CarD family transcriptional regulator, partial [Micromonospora sp. NPDC051296]|uniref:CarD family transcriptional regulator n=1 Tax=Micromonospora sp. NPDC051296 TaxID=3155046 RepID=UPI003439BC42
MTALTGLFAAALADSGLARVRDLARSGAAQVDGLDLTAPPALRPFAVAAVAADPASGDPTGERGGTASESAGGAAPGLANAAAAAGGGAGRPVLAVTATSREAEDLVAALGGLLPPEQVAIFPSWETLPHERLSPRSDTVGRRLAVLRRLAHPDSADAHGRTGPLRVVVAPVRSVLQPQLKGLGDLEPVRLAAGAEADLEQVARRLTDMAYARVDLVTKRGEFAVRGGILDVFPPTDEHPSRVEFWGDEVEEIRTFAVADQRTIEQVAQLWAPPCRELLLTPAVRERAAELAGQHPELAEILDKLAGGVPVEGMESLAPALIGGDSMELLLDCMPAGTHVLLCDPERIRTRAHDLVRTSEEFLQASWAAAAVGGQAPIDLGAAAFRTLADVRAAAGKLRQPWWTLSPFGLADGLDSDRSAGSRRGGRIMAEPGAAPERRPWEDEPEPVDITPDDAIAVTLTAQPAPLYHGETARVVDDLKRWAGEGWSIALVFEGHGPAQRAVEVLRDGGLGARMVEQVPAAPAPGELLVTCGSLTGGFVDEAARFVLLTGNDITGGRGTSTRDMRKMPSRRRNTIDPLELRAGDHVVHEQHGIGRYVELVQRTVNGASREYLVIEYAPSKRGQPGDRLFVPTDQLDQLSRYVGGEQPTLHKMGGSDWQKSKARARKAVREIAAQLIQLYAARKASKGHNFGPDTPWQRELEDAFPWQETPDQLAAIEEVKRDMEQSVPMDRLICGDVGYGKTEIAVRAAFKAVQDGKQVAVLVPTTLLVQQHYNTFAERMSQFPVTIRQLSRFQTPKEAEQALAMVADGTADIV